MVIVVVVVVALFGSCDYFIIRVLSSAVFKSTIFSTGILFDLLALISYSLFRFSTVCLRVCNISHCFEFRQSRKTF